MVYMNNQNVWPDLGTIGLTLSCFPDIFFFKKIDFGGQK